MACKARGQSSKRIRLFAQVLKPMRFMVGGTMLVSASSGMRVASFLGPGSALFNKARSRWGPHHGSVQDVAQAQARPSPGSDRAQARVRPRLRRLLSADQREVRSGLLVEVQTPSNGRRADLKQSVCVACRAGGGSGAGARLVYQPGRRDAPRLLRGAPLREPAKQQAETSSLHVTHCLNSNYLSIEFVTAKVMYVAWSWEEFPAVSP